MLAVLRRVALVAGLLCAAAAAVVLGRVAVDAQELALAAPFGLYGDHGFTKALPALDRGPLVVPADGSHSSRASRVVLLEERAPLGPAHAPHAELGAAGGGAYSHWGGMLYFSTSDGSDPNTNGRRYTLHLPLELPTDWSAPLGAAAALGLLVWLSGRRARALAGRVLLAASVATGVALLSLDLAGLVLSDDLPARFASRIDDTTLTYGETRAAIRHAREGLRVGALDEVAFLDAMTAAVNARMTNVEQCFVDEQHAMRLSACANWLLVALNRDGRYDDYELQDPDRALRRGLGTCGAQVITLLRLLAEDGYTGQLWGSGVHVVARVLTPRGRVFVLDPDYGVTLRGGPAELAADPDRVRAAYARRRQATDGEITAVIDAHFAEGMAPNLQALDGLVGTRYAVGRFHGLDPLEFERRVFLAKWLVPLALLLPGLWALARRRARRMPA